MTQQNFIKLYLNIGASEWVRLCGHGCTNILKKGHCSLCISFSGDRCGNVLLTVLEDSYLW